MSHSPSLPLDRLWKDNRLDKMTAYQTDSTVRVYQNAIVPNIRKAATVFLRMPVGEDVAWANTWEGDGLRVKLWMRA